MERPKLEILLQFIQEEKGNQWLEKGLSLLPQERQIEIRQYLSPMDGLRSLTGLLLACQLLQIAPSKLANLERDEWNRPHLPESSDFNISHCKGMVAAARTDKGKVGLDVEAWRKLRLEQFERVFCPSEMAYIGNSEDFEQAFFRIWTRKEALIKADGRGMQLDMKAIDVLQDEVMLEGKPWVIRNLVLPRGWSGAIACSLPNPNVAMEIFESEQAEIWLEALAQIAKA